MDGSRQWGPCSFLTKASVTVSFPLPSHWTCGGMHSKQALLIWYPVSITPLLSEVALKGSKRKSGPILFTHLADINARGGRGG